MLRAAEPKKQNRRTAEVETAKATGYCELTTVRRVVAEKRASDEATFVSPAKRYKRDRKRIVVDDFDLEGIRRAVHEFYSDKKYPTVRWNRCLHCLKKEVYLMVNVLSTYQC